MAEHNYKQRDAGGRVREPDRLDLELHVELDDELDAALAKYASVEPRPGLEERVLASLRAERQSLPHRGFWRWSALAATAALAVVLIVAWAVTWKPGSPDPDPKNTANKASQNSPDKTAVTAPVIQSGARFASMHKPAAPRAHPQVVVAAHPKLAQFPSPHPLSEQEKLLASYVANSPATAALVAQARAETLQKDLKDMEEEADAGSQGSTQ